MKKSRYRISKDLGMPHQTVYKWFSGQSYPRLPHLVSLANVLDMTLTETVELLKASVMHSLRKDDE